MSETYAPTTDDQLRDLIAWAFAEKAPLEIIGRGSKRDLGNPVADVSSNLATLDLSALAGVGLYEPGELVLTAAPGTPVAEIDALLAEHNQRLAFEPMDMGLVLGGPAENGSLGGMISCNLAGPRRISAGAARDHILGVKGITGRGETFKSGGRVVKNVTGYDMSKLMTGAYGTLGAITELSIKVLPVPEKAWTVLVFGLDDQSAIRALARAAGSRHEVSGLAHLPAASAANSGVGYVAGAAASVTAIRLEGPGPSVEYRAAALKDELKSFGEVEELHSKNTSGLWREIRDVRLLDHGAVLWRLSVAPSAGAAVVADIRQRLGNDRNSQATYDWQGGLIWLALGDGHDPAVDAVRGAVDAVGGHATLIRASIEARRDVPVFHPQAPTLAALSRRLKEALDPHGVFNPDRLAANGQSRLAADGSGG
jgi:glycolate oxidase FAD binding subunit